MKKLLCITLAVLLSLSILAVAALAASPSASLTGPDTVRAGDTVTLTFKLNGTGILGASGTLSYDSSQLELKSTEQKIKSPWIVEFDGNNFVAYDNNLSNPINSSTSLFTVKFKVKSDLAVGTKISVSYTDVTTSDGAADSSIGSVTYSVKLAAPKSTDNTLKSLSASNATISPAFSSDVTRYTAEVPFEVEKLDLMASANDSKATVSIDNPTLKPGGTTDVTVTVTAENGSVKVYTISVKREQDPNYVPSGDNDLSGITVEGFLLSPFFDPTVTEYVIWLPYETESVTISGTASDALASVEVVGGEVLEAGRDNVIQIICTAENGQQKIYTVIAKRAAAHGEQPTDPSLPSDPSEPSQPSEPSEPSVPTEPSAPQQTEPQGTEPDTDPPSDNQEVGVFKLWMLIAAAVICFALGLGIGLLVGRRGTF